jgi:hypothetical protein
LTDDHFIDASNVEIAVQGGIVTLTGTVSSRHEKRRAEDLIEHLSGVKDVNNSLRVDDSRSEQRTDAGKTVDSQPASREQTSRH